MVYRSPEANSGGNGQGAKAAGRQEEGKTVWSAPASLLMVALRKPRAEIGDLPVVDLNHHCVFAGDLVARTRSLSQQDIRTGDTGTMVTEFGTAELKGQTVEEHAKRWIAIAHPDDRENPS
jgi:hypothetical protein